MFLPQMHRQDTGVLLRYPQYEKLPLLNLKIT